LYDLVDGADRVVAAMRWSGTGRLSGVRSEQEVFNVYTLHDGLIVRVQSFLDREQALTAADLRE
jgi:ketosteroid isomerase-like protein